MKSKIAQLTEKGYIVVFTNLRGTVITVMKDGCCCQICLEYLVDMADQAIEDVLTALITEVGCDDFCSTTI